MKKVNGVSDARTIGGIELKGDSMGVLDSLIGNDMKNIRLGAEYRSASESSLGTDLKGDA